MGIENAKNGKLLYHLTKFSNLDSIIQFGLIPRKVLLDNQVSFGDVANPEIIYKRDMLGLENYIPFHFHPYSSFDVAVKNTYADEEMVYICISRSLARNNGFKILPKHPLSLKERQLYDYDEGFELIQWDVMTKAGLTDEDSKHIKMAECLSDKVIPVECFLCLYVASDKVKKQVEDLLTQHGVVFPPPFVNVMPQWFEHV